MLALNRSSRLLSNWHMRDTPQLGSLGRIFFRANSDFNHLPAEFNRLSPEYKSLIDAIHKRDDNTFNSILKTKKIDVNIKWQGGSYLLWEVISRGNLFQLRKLIDAGADVNISSNFNRTPLMCSICHDNIEATEILLKAKADPTKVDDLKKNLWHNFVVSSEDPRMYHILESAGIQNMIDHEDLVGHTPLSRLISGVIAWNYPFSFLEFFLKQGVNSQREYFFADFLRNRYKLSKGGPVSLKQFVIGLENSHRFSQDQQSKVLDLIKNSQTEVSVSPRQPASRDSLSPIEEINPSFNAVPLKTDSAKLLESELRYALPSNVILCFAVKSKEEIKTRWKQEKEQRKPNYITELAMTLANNKFSPPELIIKINDFVKEYRKKDVFIDDYFSFSYEVMPRFLCAFSKDPNMQNHLKDLWRVSRDYPDLWPKVSFALQGAAIRCP